MKNGDQSAHPGATTSYNMGIPEIQYHGGLTKREYFAGIAMGGLSVVNYSRTDDKQIVKRAVSMADELLKQLEQ